jgi:hypothetical protein
MPKLAVLARPPWHDFRGSSMVVFLFTWSPSLMGYFVFSIACTVWTSIGQFKLGDPVFKRVLSPVFTFKIDYSRFGENRVENQLKSSHPREN